jgi:hypothetical protein
MVEELYDEEELKDENYSKILKSNVFELVEEISSG